MLNAYLTIFRKLPIRLKRLWILLIPISLFAAILESLGVVLIFYTVQFLNNPETLQLPAALSFLQNKSFLTMAICLVIVFVIKNTSLIFFWTFRNRVAAQTQVFLSRKLLDHYLHEDYQFHLERNSSELIRNIIDSVDQVCLIGFNGLFALINYVLVAIAIIIMLFVLSPIAGLLMMLITGLLIFIVYRMSRAYLKKQSQISEKAKKQRLQILSELFSSIREIFIFGKQDYWIDHFSQQQARYAKGYSRGMSVTSASSLLIEIFLITALMIMAGVFLIGGEQQTQLLFPVLGAYAYAVARLIPIIRGISLNLGMVQYSQESLNNITHYLDFEHQPTGIDKIDPENEKMIEVSDLNFTYPGKKEPVFDAINFKIKLGEFVAIVGASGSGKSTLFSLLLGLLKDYQGNIRVCGHNLSDVTKDWQSLIGYVPQEITLIDDSIRANIAFGVEKNKVDQEWLYQVIKKVHLDDLIETLNEGVDTLVGEHGMQLSGGQRQRLAIARALYRKPEFLFLDEPTSSLDLETENVITQTLQELQGELTILIIAHRPSTIEHCDYLIKL